MKSYPTIGQLVLYSSDKRKLASFFSHLLDVEIVEGDQSLNLYNDQFSLSILDGQGIATANDMLICLELASESDIEDLFSKLQFMSYRSNENYLPGDAEVIRVTNGPVYFDAYDSDGRLWRFQAHS